MKKLLITVMLLLVVASCLILASCSGECSHSGGTATCDAKAKCASCGELYGEILGHDWAEATCLAPKTCTRCNKTEGASLGHDEIIEVINPTCTDQGITNITCSRCPYTAMRDPVDELGHDIQTGVEKEPTCSEEGSEIIYCTRCTYGTKKSIATLPHTEKYEIIEPTCEVGGITNITCENCSYTATKDPTEPLKHNLLTETKVEADCFNGGEDRVYCTRCTYEYIKEVEKKGHDIIDMGVEPTCTEDGYEKMACSRCDYVESETPIESSGHAFSSKGTCARCLAPKDIVLSEQVKSVTASHSGGGSANVNKLFDGEKITTGLYSHGDKDYYPAAIGDYIEIVLTKEFYVNELCLYICGNWTEVNIYAYDEEGNETAVALDVVYQGATDTEVAAATYVNFGKNALVKKIKIVSKSFKWNDGRTQKLCEIEIFTNHADAMPYVPEKPEETPAE